MALDHSCEWHRTHPHYKSIGASVRVPFSSAKAMERVGASRNLQSEMLTCTSRIAGVSCRGSE